MCLRSFNVCHFKNGCFEWKQKHVVFMHVSLNANELLLPAPFSRIVMSLPVHVLVCSRACERSARSIAIIFPSERDRPPLAQYAQRSPKFSFGNLLIPESVEYAKQ